jgi:DNA-binding transcriptional regulator YiaG
MKKLIYEGLGFSVVLKGVKTFQFRGETLPKINHRELEDMVFKALLRHPAHFSGAQLSFVRGYMKLSQKKFASMLGLSTHATISGWEGKKNHATGMPVATEVVIRLLMAEFIGDATFASHFREFLDVQSLPIDLEMKVA